MAVLLGLGEPPARKSEGGPEDLALRLSGGPSGVNQLALRPFHAAPTFASLQRCSASRCEVRNRPNTPPPRPR
eukprot:12435038-Alexandrium_andersonii.AAC.1